MFQFDQGAPTASGHVFRREGARGPVWYAKYRLAGGRQVQRRIGPAWTERGRPGDGFFTRRTAEAWLRALLREADAGTLPGAVRTGATFADAAAEWLRYVEHDRACKPTTMRGYRAVVQREFIPLWGERRLEDVTGADIERWRAGLSSGPRTKNKNLTILRGIFKRAARVYGLRHNPAYDIEKLREPTYTDLEVFSPEEVMALVRAAASEQDAAVYLTAAFTGLRLGELLALTWRDVDFAGSVVRVRASYSGGHLTTHRRAARSAPCRWRRRSRRRSLALPTVRAGPATTTWSSAASSAATWTGPRSTAATAPRSNAPACGRCASTTCATRSARG